MQSQTSELNKFKISSYNLQAFTSLFAVHSPQNRWLSVTLNFLIQPQTFFLYQPNKSNQNWSPTIQTKFVHYTYDHIEQPTSVTKKNLHPKYTTDEASHGYSGIIKATRKDLLTRRRVSTGIWISSKYLDMPIASSIEKKKVAGWKRRRKREWVWRTVSSRLADRDNRVSPGFHCVQDSCNL